MEADDEATELLEDLTSHIDDLESALKPFLDGSFTKRAEKSTPIERAKLYSWAVYTIDSLLFSYINLSGSNGKSHPVFTELKRVQQYFQKIDAVENPSSGKVLDKPAVKRFVERGLEGNDRWDKQREEMKAREREGAKRKFEELDARIKDRENEEGKENKKKKKKEKNKERSERRKKLESATHVEQEEVSGVKSSALAETQVTSTQPSREGDGSSPQRKKNMKNRDKSKKRKAES